MKKALMLCAMLGLMVGFMGCKQPPAPAELGAKVDSLEARVGELETTLEGVSVSLDSLITTYEDHIKEYHAAAPAPRVPRPPKLPPVRKK